ncbi:MAG: dihydrofolate reductase [Thermonemataceae bacterium]|nr:dihydrofolate reductase [Thermonemataceae bacterium]
MMALIVAVAENNVIGSEGKIPWHLAEDMNFFRKLTEHNVIIMGRKTFESLPRRLPNRIHIIISRNRRFVPPYDDCYVVNSLDAAIDFSRTFVGKNIFIIGGGEIYQQALQKKAVEKIFLTKVQTEPKGDTFFPVVNPQDWQETNKIHFFKNEKNDYDFDIIEFGRINKS